MNLTHETRACLHMWHSAMCIWLSDHSRRIAAARAGKARITLDNSPTYLGSEADEIAEADLFIRSRHFRNVCAMLGMAYSPEKILQSVVTGFSQGEGVAGADVNPRLAKAAQLRAQVYELHDRGVKQAQIAEIVGSNSGHVSYILRKRRAAA